MALRNQIRTLEEEKPAAEQWNQDKMGNALYLVHTRTLRSNGATKIISLISSEFAMKVRGEDYYEDEQPTSSGRISFDTKIVVDADAFETAEFSYVTATLVGIIGILLFLLWQTNTRTKAGIKDKEEEGAAEPEVEPEVKKIEVSTQTSEKL